MGAKAWFIAYFDDDPTKALANPELNRDAALDLAKHLLPERTLEAKGDGPLSFLNPPENEAWVGCYAGLQVIAHDDLAGDYPSKLDPHWLDPSLGRNAYLHATHSVVDWLAFGLWRDGKLVRSLSVSPDNGIQEQIGDPLPFERPYWNGDHPVDGGGAAYPLPFHPLELSEASMLYHLGFQFEGHPNDWVSDPDEIPLVRFAVSSKRRLSWKFWE